jgi:hypothetical protein
MLGVSVAQPLLGLLVLIDYPWEIRRVERLGCCGY